MMAQRTELVSAEEMDRRAAEFFSSGSGGD
jgi:hypothetical protein